MISSDGDFSGNFSEKLKISLFDTISKHIFNNFHYSLSFKLKLVFKINKFKINTFKKAKRESTFYSF